MDKDTGHFVQIYRCKNGHEFYEEDIIPIKAHNVCKLLCPVAGCHTDNIECIGDTRDKIETK